MRMQRASHACAKCMLRTCHACAMHMHVHVPCICMCMCVCLAEGALAQDADDLVAVEYMVVRDDGIVASLVIVPWVGSGSGLGVGVGSVRRRTLQRMARGLSAPV